jgi:hypothetical protein
MFINFVSEERDIKFLGMCQLEAATSEVFFCSHYYICLTQTTPINMAHGQIHTSTVAFESFFVLKCSFFRNAMDTVYVWPHALYEFTMHEAKHKLCP